MFLRCDNLERVLNTAELKESASILRTCRLSLWMVYMQIERRGSIIYKNRDIFSRKLVGFFDCLLIDPVHVVFKHSDAPGFNDSLVHYFSHIGPVHVTMLDNFELSINPVELPSCVINCQINWPLYVLSAYQDSALTAVHARSFNFGRVAPVCPV